MKRNIIIAILLLLIFSVAAGIIYLNNVYLPVTFKQQLSETLESRFNYNVRIGKIKYDLIHGIVIQDIAIFDQAEDKTNTILSVKEISSNVLFYALIRDRKVILPVIHVDSPFINIRYLKDGSLNFRKALQPQIQQKQKSHFSVLVYKINLFNIKCVFSDERLTPNFTKTLQDANLGLQITPWAKISFLLRGRLTSDEKTFTKINVEGNYNLLSKETGAEIIFVNLIISDYDPYLRRLPFSIISGNFETVDLNIKFKDNILSVRGPADIKALELKVQDLLLRGNVAVSPQLIYDFGKKKLSYKTNFNFKQAQLSGLPHIGTVENLTGEVGLEENKIRTANLKLKAFDSDFTLSGSLQNFSLPYLKLKLNCAQLDLAKLAPLLPAETQKTVTLSGKSSIEADINGYLKDITTTAKAALQIQDAALQFSRFKNPISNISGAVQLSAQGASWKDLNFSYLNTPYQTTGKLDNFSMPSLTATLKSKDLDLETDIVSKKKTAQINRLAGKFKDSEFNIKGSLQIEDPADPYCDLNLQANLDTSNIKALLGPDAAENFKKINPKGNLALKGTTKGRLKDFKNLQASLKVNSDAFSIYNLNFSKLSFNLEQKDGALNIPRLIAYAYSGLINADCTANLRDELIGYTLKMSGSGIDLGKLKTDTALQNKDLSGILELDGSLTGNIKDLNSSGGRLYFSISKGKLWQLDLLKGLGELILLPEFDKLVFKKAEAEFIIGNKYFSTDNLLLAGDQVTLEGKGSIGFDGSLAFSVYAKVNKELLKESADIRKFITAILGEISSAISINVGGTIKQPKYTLIPLPVDLIKNIKDFILGK